MSIFISISSDFEGAPPEAASRGRSARVRRRFPGAARPLSRRRRVRSSRTESWALVHGPRVMRRGGSTSPRVPLGGILREKLPASLAHMAHVFVYGTLKTGQPNHKVLRDGANGRAAFRGQGRTLEPHPLVIAGEHNIPWLLNLPGRGLRVLGEIYAVDERMLRFLDEFEGCPDMYQRTRVRIAVLEWEGARSASEGTPVLEWEGAHSAPKGTPAADGTLQCFVYSTATYSPEWVHLPYHDSYDSQGEHGLRYNPRESR
ncbi:Gamma-glutamylaminecyclotransferase [Manis javanica]|nr:Gamma-glutamylaminecyclotransferase [Manis javanica]